MLSRSPYMLWVCIYWNMESLLHTYLSVTKTQKTGLSLYLPKPTYRYIIQQNAKKKKSFPPRVTLKTSPYKPPTPPPYITIPQYRRIHIAILVAKIYIYISKRK